LIDEIQYTVCNKVTVNAKHVLKTCICSHLYVQFWMLSLWETLAARKETDMRMCGIMELEVDRIWVPFAILCIVDPIYPSLIVIMTSI